MNKLFRASSKGFTLIEVLIATAILVMVGVAAIGVEKQFMGSAGVNKHKLQATALAQEGVSAVRADYNYYLLGNSGTSVLVPGPTYYLGTDNQFHECSGTCHKIDATHPQGDIDLNGVTFTRTITIP